MYCQTSEKKVKELNLLDQKIDEELKRLKEESEEEIQAWKDAYREEFDKVKTLQEELNRLKKEQRKLVNSVGKWSALAIDRKQYLDEANKKIEELNTLLNRCYNFIKPYDDGGSEASYIIDEVESLTK